MSPRNICIANYLLILIGALLFSACGSSKQIKNSDLEQVQIKIEQLDTESADYLMILAGFQNSNSSVYKETLNRLQNARDGDVIEIEEIFNNRSEMNSSTEIHASIKKPISLNRVLWSLGKEHFREHRVDYEIEHTGRGFQRDQMPELIGGLDEIQRQVRYPSELKGSNIEGQVYVRFIVTEFGEVIEPEITTSLHEAADKEAIRVIKNARFVPSEHDGVPIRVQYSLPVTFKSR